MIFTSLIGRTIEERTVKFITKRERVRKLGKKRILRTQTSLVFVFSSCHRQQMNLHKAEHGMSEGEKREIKYFLVRDRTKAVMKDTLNWTSKNMYNIHGRCARVHSLPIEGQSFSGEDLIISSSVR